MYDALFVDSSHNELNHAFKAKHLFCLKSGGLGVTEFFLRVMAWLAVRNDDYRNCQMVVVCGPNQDIAIKLIKRMKALFEPKLGIIFQDKETSLQLNGCSIQAYPSNHTDSYRALDKPKFILVDEGDMFRKSEQAEVRAVTERYVPKSDPYIALVSTPGSPGGLFESIQREPNETTIYKRFYMDYTVGLGHIYSAEEIANAKMTPNFQREFNLKFLGKIGNVFHTKDIDLAVEKGKLYNPDIVDSMHFTKRSLGVDPAWGSSAFGLVVTEWVDNHVRILHAEERHHPDFNMMLSLIYGLISEYQIDKTYVDGSAVAFIKSLKIQIGEEADYENVIQRYKSQGLESTDNAIAAATKNMKIIPVNFAKHHKDMLAHTKMVLEDGYLSINPKFDKLIVALKTAVENDGSLSKEESSHHDILDGLRLALRLYKFEQES